MSVRLNFDRLRHQPRIRRWGTPLRDPVVLAGEGRPPIVFDDDHSCSRRDEGIRRSRAERALALPEV